MSALHPATLRQNQASEPGSSTWLSANAGSGKTKVLTDRVARLLLDGVSPENILCLTFTKAAAGEMQNRLFKRLGEWAMMPDPNLADALAGLGVPESRDLSRARTLFARAIETPGGLKIQTIHSFCSGLLRRFPLEAGISPRFTEIDEIAQRHLMSDIAERVAGEGGLDALARFAPPEDFARLMSAIATHRRAFSRAVGRDELHAVLGLPPGAGPDTPLRIAFDGTEAAWLPEVRRILAKHSDTMVKLAEQLGRINPASPGPEDLARLCKAFLYAGRPEAKTGSVPTKTARDALGGLIAPFHDWMERVARARNAQLALDMAARTEALHDFGRRFLAAYEAEKRARGWLDFDDLILKAGALLSDPSVAQWVLYRLDGGLDHVLVDEAQDTSPEQWEVVSRLVQEFGTGAGARPEAPRTLFVVGDKKQSIYSFQGADAEAFDAMFPRFRERLAAEGGLQRLSLEHSFRSSIAVLSAVDRVFAGDTDEGLGIEITHRAFHEAMPGRVDLWPVLPAPESPERPHWSDPVDLVSDAHPSGRLASLIASEISALIDDPAAGITDRQGNRRRIVAGDFLVLVQGRTGSGDLFHRIIRACKAQGLPVAGADRLRIGAELAVRDLRALLAFLALPEDSLSLAAALRSPLFGWSEEALHELAAGRAERHLWTTLRQRRDMHAETVDALDALRREADFLRPYDLIERILIGHGGRTRLLSRLGPEAEDGIDELLNLALSYERTEVPSLTGFLSWLEQEDTDVKRQLESAGGRIRVMTVHGAKGLESPIVILPDTLRAPRPNRDEILARGAPFPIWKARKEETPRPVAEMLAERAEAERRERNRLLYVAMTRAENWLIVCGAGERPKNGGTWYDAIEGGLHAAGAVPHGFAAGEGLRHEVGDWSPPPAAAVADAAGAAPPPELPAWATAPAAAPVRPPATLSPSDLGGPKALPGAADALDEEAALRRGRQLHLLLEHLPSADPSAHAALARDLLAFGPDAAPEAEAEALAAEVSALVAAPELAHLFAPEALAEVWITADLPDLGGRRISGKIDRLIVGETEVLAVDFKTNAEVPAGPEDTPEGVLRQIGAYHAALERVYPEHTVRSFVLWTRTARLMPMPRDIVISALRRTAIS